MKTSDGFSLIEMLAATVLLGVLITAVLAPLTQLFQNTGDNGQALRVTTQAQEVIESIRGQWRSYPASFNVNNLDQNAQRRVDSRNRYDRTCSIPLSQLNGITQAVTMRALDRNGAVTGAPLTLSTCSNPLPTPQTNPVIFPMKRLTITTTTADGSRSNLTVDIPRP